MESHVGLLSLFRSWIYTALAFSDLDPINLVMESHVGLIWD
jgi:hypothetical protein